MPLFFYKVSDPYGCFSNFSPHPVHLDGYTWPTSEHFYQAQKYQGTDHSELCTKIREAPTAEAAAALGRGEIAPMRPDWDQVKAQIMYDVVKEKFSRHGDIRAILLSTGDTLIVENSPTDSYWGCGPDQKGNNQLGKILMQVRQELRSFSVR
ncbi:MAG: NADAR family protein [Thermosynechococcaceae cyanobacterium]